MSNPINVQAQRILNLITEMKEKLEMLAWITPEFLGHVAKQKEQLSDALNPEIIAMLVGHLKWEEDYKQLCDEIKEVAENEEAQIEGEEGRNKEEDLQKLSELTGRIKQSIRNTLRYFAEKRGDFEKLRDLIGTKRSSKVNDFALLFANQYEIFRQKMTTSKEEEDSKAEQLKLLEQKIIKLRKEKEDKINSLNEHKANKAKFLAEAKRELEKLRKEIKEVRDTRENELIMLNKERDQEMKYNEEEHKRNMEKLSADLKKKEEEIKALIEVNKNEEEKNRNSLSACIRQQFNEKIVDYDTTMAAKVKEREEERKLLKEEMKVLDDNVRMLKEITESNAMFKKEEEDFKKQLEKHNMLLEAKAQATLWIQSHWRGYKARTERRK